MSNVPVISVPEPDPNVTPLPTTVGKHTFFARLRAGLHIQVGSDPNDPGSFIYGPADVPVNPQMAIAHMAKWEDPNAVKKWLAQHHPKLVAGKPHLLPMTQKRLTPRERMDRDVAQAEAINGTGKQNKGLTPEDVRTMVKAQVAPLQKQLDQIVELLTKGPEKA